MAGRGRGAREGLRGGRGGFGLWVACQLGEWAEMGGMMRGRIDQARGRECGVCKGMPARLNDQGRCSIRSKALRPDTNYCASSLSTLTRPHVVAGILDHPLSHAIPSTPHDIFDLAMQPTHSLTNDSPFSSLGPHLQLQQQTYP